jgi:DNA-binding transcriptional regulator YdaS (Cro superfamily)
MRSFEKVVEHFGSQANLARELCVTRQAITLWKVLGAIPPGNAVEIERITNGKFKAVDLVIKKGE